MPCWLLYLNLNMFWFSIDHFTKGFYNQRNQIWNYRRVGWYQIPSFESRGTGTSSLPYKAQTCRLLPYMASTHPIVIIMLWCYSIYSAPQQFEKITWYWSWTDWVIDDDANLDATLLYIHFQGKSLAWHNNSSWEFERVGSDVNGYCWYGKHFYIMQMLEYTISLYQ
jgi:hypothetical protein